MDAEIVRGPAALLQVESIHLRRTANQMQENTKFGRSSGLDLPFRPGLQRAEHGQKVKAHESRRPNFEKSPATEFWNEQKLFFSPHDRHDRLLHNSLYDN